MCKSCIRAFNAARAADEVDWNAKLYANKGCAAKSDHATAGSLHKSWPAGTNSPYHQVPQGSSFRLCMPAGISWPMAKSTSPLRTHSAICTGVLWRTES